VVGVSEGAGEGGTVENEVAVGGGTVCLIEDAQLPTRMVVRRNKMRTLIIVFLSCI